MRLPFRTWNKATLEVKLSGPGPVPALLSLGVYSMENKLEIGGKEYTVRGLQVADIGVLL